MEVTVIAYETGASEVFEVHESETLAEFRSRVATQLYDGWEGLIQLEVGGDRLGCDAEFLRTQGLSAGDEVRARLFKGIKAPFVYDCNSRVHAVAVSHDGRRVYSCCLDKIIRVWGTESGKCEGELTGHTNAVSGVAVAPDGRRVYTSSHDSTVRVWDPKTLSCIKVLQQHTQPVYGVVVSACCTRLYSFADDESVLVWNTATLTVDATFDRPSSIVAVTELPDGSTLYSGHVDGKVCVWDLQLLEYRGEFGTTHGRVHALASTSDLVFTGGADGNISVWGAESWDLMRTLNAHKGWVGSLAMSPNFETVYSCGRDEEEEGIVYGRVRAWGTSDGERKGDIRVEGWLETVAVSGCGQFVFAGYHSGTVHVMGVDSVMTDESDSDSDSTSSGKKCLIS